MSNKHEFETNGLKLRVIKITPEIRFESQKWFAKALNDAMRGGYPLRIEMERELENRKAYDPAEDEKKATDIRKNIKDLEIKLRQGIVGDRKMTKDEGKALALQIRSERAKLREIGTAVANFFSNTAENFASGEQMQYWLYACTVHADTGAKYWESYEKFKTDTESEVYKKAAEEFLALITGVDKLDDAERYENRWLLKMGYLDKDLNLIDGQGRTVDIDGKLIDKNGRYVDASGAFVDVYGNRVSESGELLVADSWAVIDKVIDNKI